MAKKFTDEDIAKAILQQIEYGAGIPYINEWQQVKTIKFTEVLEFIHRLQSENERLKDEKEEIRLFNLAIQNGEVDMRIESEMAKSFYNSIVQVFEQNGAKNFFTTTIDIEGKNGRYAFTIEKVGGQTVAEKLAEQKDEIERLTERNAKYLESIESLTVGKCVLRCELTRQAVKETAKDLLIDFNEWINEHYDAKFNAYCVCIPVDKVSEFLMHKSKEYGVEVE
jgi:hypothetical protein